MGKSCSFHIVRGGDFGDPPGRFVQQPAIGRQLPEQLSTLTQVQLWVSVLQEFFKNSDESAIQNKIMKNQNALSPSSF